MSNTVGAPPAPSADFGGRPPRLLLVDDERVIHVVFGELLTGTGLELVAVSSAEEALARLQKETFDLAIVDKNLPGMSGLDLMRVLSSVQVNLRFIVITGFSSVDSAVEALQLGAIDYLLKPFGDLETVAAKIRKALTRVAGEQAARLAQGAGSLEPTRRINAALIPLMDAYERLAKLASASPDEDAALAPARDALLRARNILLGQGGTKT